jgi:four helix bundle protein
MQRFAELKVWQRSYAFAIESYRVTRSFPSEERFGLTTQLRRSASSVPTNIAEGSKCSSIQEFARFLNIAERSLAEAEPHLMMSRDLGYLPAAKVEELLHGAAGIGSMLFAFRRKVERDRQTAGAR